MIYTLAGMWSVIALVFIWGMGDSMNDVDGILALSAIAAAACYLWCLLTK
jgi:hypothetical protein